MNVGLITRKRSLLRGMPCRNARGPSPEADAKRGTFSRYHRPPVGCLGVASSGFGDPNRRESHSHTALAREGTSAALIAGFPRIRSRDASSPHHYKHPSSAPGFHGIIALLAARLTLPCSNDCIKQGLTSFIQQRIAVDPRPVP